MRSRKMAAALAAGAWSLAALVSAGSTATAAPTGSCHIQLNPISPRLVEAGETALVSGRIICKQSGAASKQSVTLFEKVAGGAASGPVGAAESNTIGTFQITSPTLEKNTYFYVTSGGATSAKRLVKVSPKVTITEAPPEGSILFTGHGSTLGLKTAVFPSKVTFKGKVSPALAGDNVFLQRENAISGEEWHRIGRGTVSKEGTFTIEHTFAIPGAVSIRVLVARTKVSAPGVSESLSYVILQAQNPNLTIVSSKDPVSFGEPVTISGVDKAGPGVKLTLFARNVPGKAFTAVATTTTEAGGEYKFAPLTPLQNTTYKVAPTGGKAVGSPTSAPLFEGVKFVLTATASASSVLQGQTVTFSGSASPAVAGHPIYLQVEFPSGIAFHTIEVGVVGPTGAYSIPYVPFVVAKHNYRVRIPGDPGHEGAGSKVFTLETLPNPSGVIKAEPPGNSSQPNPGK